ncbi:MAG: triose-phosphate isomerase, partial [Elusimicrobia bacterium RIFOXYA12_FULL_57_11]
SKIFLSSQDVAWEEKGAFTGAVAPAQLLDAGCTHAIIGHSERRKIFLETDEVINKKMKAAIKANLVPVLCIGETLEERESQKTYRVLETQLNGAFAGITAAEAAKVVIAYEPVWAIGTGKTATPDQAQDAHVFVRKQVERIYGKPYAEAVRVLYGGSVKADNVDELMAQPDIDGALVGGESLKADKFLRVIHFQAVLSR